VLVKGGAVLETAARTTLVAFDKTGTLTVGRPSVRAVEALDGDADRLLALAAAAEAGSEHPYGRAIVAEATARGLVVAESSAFTATAGHGVTATVAGRAALVGKAELLTAAGVAIKPLAAPAERLAQAGITPLLVAADGQPLGVIGVADAPRPEAREVVARLQAAGLRVAMLTGDDEQVARAVAAELGIGEVHARLLPTGKGEALAAWRAAGEVVAMVGDGINDAPALALADVGLAMGGGTDVALETGDISLLRDDLRGVPLALALSRAVMAAIRANLGWAFGYNLVMIPLAAGLVPGLGLDPMWAAAAMALSSVSVVGNSLRLRGFAGARPVWGRRPRRECLALPPPGEGGSAGGAGADGRGRAGPP
jgi:Cu+-exporting ATPase